MADSMLSIEGAPLPASARDSTVKQWRIRDPAFYSTVLRDITESERLAGRTTSDDSGLK
jgi:hypothetical protein